MSIASEVVERAKAFAAAHRATRPPRSHRAPLVVSETEHVVAKMASDLLDVVGASGSVDEADLLALGWTAEAIRRHLPAASERADAMRERAV